VTAGDEIDTRNHLTISHFDLPNTTFTEFPLVTLKKTAVKKAIKEMEWFMSGQSVCPDNLLDWWKGQLNERNQLVNGYPWQFRVSSFANGFGELREFDQVKFILDGLKNSPNSRRLILSAWNPGEMANITKDNDNINTPTCCHSIVVQFFVRDGKLHMKTYQRSADMLLGVPHNWVQSWAMLLYFAYHSGLRVGSMIWMWGDAHIYKEQTHLDAIDIITEANCLNHCVDLVYNPKTIAYDMVGVPIFRADDFEIFGEIPEPVVTHKINLL